MVDAVFVSSNVSKVLDGGWFPLLAGGVLFTVMTTWHKGRETLIDRMKADNLPLKDIIHSLCRGSHPPSRVEGTAVFPGGVAGMTPTAFMHNLKHNRVLHKTNIFLAGTTDNVPHVQDADKAVVEDLGDGCYAVTVRHGFMEIPDVPVLAAADPEADSGLDLRRRRYLVLPRTRHDSRDRRKQGDGALAREAVRVPRPQCGASGGVLQLAAESRGRDWAARSICKGLCWLRTKKARWGY